MEKKKIAVIVASSIYNRKGLFNAMHERVKRLNMQSKYTIVPFVISKYYPWYIRLFKRCKKTETPNHYSVDGIDYSVIWLKNTIVDFVLMHILKIPPILRYREFEKYIQDFGNYDLVITHSCGEYGEMIYKETGVPYIATWHGSDIHTLGFLSPYYKNQTKRALETAVHNFFVSNSLLLKSELISKHSNKSVSYNGRSDGFNKYDDSHRQELKDQLCPDKDVVVYIGNLEPIKNIKVLPDIFRHIQARHKDVEFWVIGDGSLREYLNKSTLDLPIKFFGNIDHSEIPNYLNVANVLVLPSLNEGLGLSIIEAISCGCNAVGSRVGGISEIIGIENTICLESDTFIKDFAERCVYYLSPGHTNQTLPDKFDWDKCVQLETDTIDNLFKEKANELE